MCTKFHTPSSSGFGDISVYLASRSGRAGSGRFTSKMDSSSKNNIFILLDHVSTINIKDFMRCRKVPYSDVEGASLTLAIR